MLSSLYWCYKTCFSLFILVIIIGAECLRCKFDEMFTCCMQHKLDPIDLQENHRANAYAAFHHDY